MDTPRDKRRQEEITKVAEQAAEWLIALDEGGAAERAAFAEWLEESPLHVEMFLRATAVSRMGELLAPEDRRELAARLTSAAAPPNVIPLEAPTSPAMPPAVSRELYTPTLSHALSEPERGRVSRFTGWAAAASLLVVAGGAALWWKTAGWDRYNTKVGEQRAVALADGSVVYANTNTRIEVRYSEGGRDIRLLHGEALFKVEPDSKRPFRVHVGEATVQAIGTQFNVYRRPTETTVAVIEGVVQISPDESPQAEGETSPPEPARLAAGQAVSVASGGPIKRPIAVNVAQVTAWRQRRLVFEWETLDTIVAEFNRYNRTPQIRVEGDDVRGRRYTAVFDADNPQTLLKFLARDSELAFAAKGDDFVIRAR
jgi:transmembrane sensor